MRTGTGTLTSLGTAIITTIDPMRDTPSEPASTASSFPSQLLIWLSPAFPVGGFAYSQGLETAVSRGLVSDARGLAQWLRAVTRHGSLRNDLILQAQILRAEDRHELRSLCELSAALQPSAERYQEARAQGAAFRSAYLSAWAPDEAPTSFDALFELPVTLAAALAIAARDHHLPASATLEAYALALHSNLVSAAIRLNVIGQFDGQRILADVLGDVRALCSEAMAATLDDLGAATFAADLASLQHETQEVRLFRS